MSTYYNEIDPHAAAWLRELIKAGLIPDGEVDTRSNAPEMCSMAAVFKIAAYRSGGDDWHH